FEKTMEEFAAADKAHPSADAFLKVKAALAVNLAPGETGKPGLEKTLFRNFKAATNQYYTLLHKSREDSLEVVSRLKHLKENFIAFYYWHALKGKVLPMPKEKLVCVLAQQEDSDSFTKQHGLFDGVAI